MSECESSCAEETENTPLDRRMKKYEHTFRAYLPRRAYTLMRLDGRAFHSYLKGAAKPYDYGFMEEMGVVALRLCEEIQGAQFAYVQSDEISLLITDFDSTQSEPWFGGNTAKMISISAALASAYMARLRISHPGLPQFDSRVWSIADPVEVANYFVWRQRDWVRNSIQMAGQAHYTQAQLHRKSTGEIQEMLFQEHRINWSEYPASAKNGRLVWNDTAGWQAISAPLFKAEPGTYLAQLIPPLPSLWDKESEGEST